MSNEKQHSPFNWLAATPTIALLELIKRSPMWVGKSICQCLGTIACSMGIRRKIIQKNLDIAFPGFDQSQKKAIHKAVFKNLAHMLYTWMTALKGGPDAVNRLVSFPDNPALIRALERGNGVVLFTAHFCNWEILAAATALKINGITIIANSLRNPYLDDYWVDMHNTFQIRSIFRKSSMREMIRTLNRGECLGLLVDQSGSSKDAFVPFFGRQTSFRRGAARLAIGKKAPIFTIFLVPCAEGGYTAELKELPYSVTGDFNADTETVMAVFAVRLESIIRRYPEHYFWLHNRWKKKPPARTDFDSFIELKSECQ